MAYEAADGKKFTNRAPMMAHKRSLEREQRKSESGGVDPLAQPAHEDADGMSDEQDGGKIASLHGPATETHTIHDHEGGRHEVHSLHPDGHTHQSVHETAGKAHDHAKKLAGGDQEAEAEEPSDQGDEMDEAEYE